MYFDLASGNLKELFLLYRNVKSPIVVKNAFSGKDIRQLTSVEKFCESFGEMIIPVTSEYMKALNRSLFGKEVPTSSDVIRKDGDLIEPSFSRGKTTVSEYLKYIQIDPLSPLLCPEVIMPEDLDSQVCTYELGDHGSFYKNDYWFNFFLGNKGNFAHTHYDWNGAVNLFYQIFGSKRITLISPESTHKLDPFSNISGIYFENMSEVELEGYFKYVGATSFDLKAGDALLIPPLYWHYIQYTDTGASLNLRFNSHRLTSWASTHLHKTPLLQIYLHDLMINDSMSDEEIRIWRSLGEIKRDHAQNFLNSVNEIFMSLYIERFSRKEGPIKHYPFKHPFSPLVDKMHLDKVMTDDFQQNLSRDYEYLNQRFTMNHLYEEWSALGEIIEAYDE
jgi:hypothetical protein